jgi:hypothetical protein
VVAIIVAGLGVLGGLILALDEFWTGIGVAAIAALTGGAYYLVFRVIAEGIGVMLDVEGNTRQTAANTLRAAQLLEDRLRRG